MNVLFIYTGYHGPQKIGLYDTMEQLNAAVCTHANVDSFKWSDDRWSSPAAVDYQYYQVTIGIIQSI